MRAVLKNVIFPKVAVVPRGQDCLEKKGKRGKRYSVIGLRSPGHKFIQPYLYEGTFKKVDFESYLSTVIPSLPVVSFLVLDNAAIHKNLSLSALFNKYQCRLIYLPPYSPELNPIEKLWGSLKTKLRNMISSLHGNFLSILWKTIESFC